MPISRLISSRMHGGWIPFWSWVGGGEGSWWSRGGKKSCGNISIHFLCLIKLLIIIPWICIKHSRFLRDFTDGSFETHTKQTDDPCLINEQTAAQKVPCPEVCGPQMVKLRLDLWFLICSLFLGWYILFDHKMSLDS